MTSKKSGVELIAAERKRQVEAEGWTPEHDDTHSRGEMPAASLCYAHFSMELVKWGENNIRRSPALWPWIEAWWKPSPDPIRNLVKAGALIAAEIDRLQRFQEASDAER